MRLHDASPKDAVRSLKAYLATITARLSLNRLRDQRARREAYVGEWLPEPLVTEDEPGVRAEDVSFAMLVVLERLSPLERVVFVLRNAFDLTFEDIAPVVRRDAATCRKIFSRARAHMREQRPRFAIDRERHRALLRSFANAARGGDIASLVALLEENVVLHGDGGGKALALKKPVVGNVAVAQFLIAVTKTLPSNASTELIELNGEPGLVLKADGHPIVAILIETDGERAQEAEAVGQNLYDAFSDDIGFLDRELLENGEQQLLLAHGAGAHLFRLRHFEPGQARRDLGCKWELGDLMLLRFSIALAAWAPSRSSMPPNMFRARSAACRPARAQILRKMC